MNSRLFGTLRLSAPAKPSERVKTFPPGRVCAVPECTTLLSTYNPQSVCSLHAILERDAPRRHPREPQALFERSCEECGSFFETANVRRRFCSDKCRVAAFQHRRSREQEGQGAVA